MSIKGINNSTELQIETFTIVPSTINGNQPISNAQFRKRVEETKNVVRKLFGGSTSVKGYGEYLLKGKHIPEKVMIVTSFSKKKDFLDSKSKWIKWIRKKREDWKQDSIGVGIEGDMYYVPKTF